MKHLVRPRVIVSVVTCMYGDLFARFAPPRAPARTCDIQMIEVRTIP